MYNPSAISCGSIQVFCVYGSLSPFLALCVVSRICVYLFFSPFFGLCPAAHGILVCPTRGRTLAPMAPALGAWSLNPWTTRKIPVLFFFNLCRHLTSLNLARVGPCWPWVDPLFPFSECSCPMCVPTPAFSVHSLCCLCVHLFPLLSVHSLHVV